ncbi:MAG: sodium-dependent transporter, partial [Thiotrichaceae bacterium]
GTLFFILVVFAAWTSSISLIEPGTAYLTENTRLKRSTAAYLISFIAWLLGVAVVLSFNTWSFSFPFAGTVKTDGLFDLLDILTSTFMLPLGGLAIAIFAGWVMRTEFAFQELNLSNKWFNNWYFTIRWISPALVILLFLHSLGVF